MKFKGIPNQLCRITKIKRSLVRKIPKSIRFDKDGIFETENPYLVKRLKTKFKVIENGFNAETLDKIKEVVESHDIDKAQSLLEEKIAVEKLPYPELQVLYAKKTGKSAVGVKKAVILKELEG